MKVIDINIPEVLNDLTLGQWQEITDLELNEGISGDFYMRRVLSIVYGIKDVRLEDLKKADVEIMMDSVRNILTQEPSFENRFTMEGVEYGFVPNLDNITFGEFTDLDEYSDRKDYHKMLSILYRPIIKKQTGGRYKIKRYRGSSDMSGMPLGIALGAVTFFLTIGLQLTSDILSSLTPEERQQWQKLTLEKSGVGMPQSIPSPREISSGSRISLN